MSLWAAGQEFLPGLTLRLFDFDDAAEMVRALHANAELTRTWLGWPASDYGVPEAQAFIHQTRVQWAEKGLLNLGIWQDHYLVGGINMNHVDLPNRSTYLGYWLAGETQGRGIMTRACRLVVDDLITRQGFNRIVIAVHPENVKSRAVAHRLGFLQEGLLRQVVRHHDQFVDWVIYAMLAEDWPVGAPA